MKKGFTLIELIFVIVIIGILGAVALPKFASIKANAKAKTLGQLYTTISRNVPTQVMSEIELDGAGADDLEIASYIDVPAGWFCEAGNGVALQDAPDPLLFANNGFNATENNMSGGVCHFTEQERASNGFMFKIGLSSDGTGTGTRNLYFHLKSNGSNVPEAAVKLYKDLARKAILDPTGIYVVDANQSLNGGNIAHTELNNTATTDVVIKPLIVSGVTYNFKAF